MRIEYKSPRKIVVTMTIDQLHAMHAALDSCVEASAYSETDTWNDVERAKVSFENAIMKARVDVSKFWYGGEK